MKPNRVGNLVWMLGNAVKHQGGCVGPHRRSGVGQHRSLQLLIVAVGENPPGRHNTQGRHNSCCKVVITDVDSMNGIIMVVMHNLIYLRHGHNIL